MRKNLPLFGKVFLVVCLWCIAEISNAQVLSSLTPVRSEKNYEFGKNQEKSVLLKDVLKDIEKYHKVFINYDDKIMDGKYVSVEEGALIDNKNHNTDQLLETILAPLAMKYEKIKENIYLITEGENGKQKITGLLFDPASPSSMYASREGISDELLFSQRLEQTISGTVKNDDGEVLPGVSVVVKGTTIGTVTDISGNYSLSVPDGSATLIFSFIGYLTEEVVVGNQTTINIKLVQDLQALSEVVVVGYGTQQKKDLTGAISVIKPQEIQKRQATTVAEAMQGLASGINVRGGGRPGSEARIQIRGLKNLQNTNPLYVIDGLITTANRDFNPNDIESIQILKDASAAAIYGSRAANGVIIITTKKGRMGPMKVDFSAKTSITTTPLYDLADTEEFSRLNYMAYDNAGVPRQDLDLSVNTDWQKEAFRQGSINDYNISFSGGGDNGKYYVSGNYFGNKGTVIDTRFDRLSFRVNTEGSRGIFSIGENLSVSNSTADEMSGNPFFDVVRLLPTIPVKDANNPGGYGYGHEAKARTFGTNPIAIADLEDRTNENLRLRGNLWSEIKPFSWLTYRLNLGYETSADHYSYLRKQGNWTLNQEFVPSIANENRARFESKLVENTLTFKKTFNKHYFNLVVGQTFQQDNYAQIWGEKRDLLEKPGGGYYNVLDQGGSARLGGFKEQAVLLSYLGRLEYTFADKYILNAVIRRDGSSRLGNDYKVKSFPSVSAAWRISNEGFFELPVVSDLKLRASYGVLGSGNIGYYDYIPVVNTFPTVVFGTNQNVYPGAIQTSLKNENLRWETLTQTNFGIDLGLLNNKLSLTADYFIAETKDVLFGYPVLETTGNDGGNPITNGATLKNTGLDFSLTYNESEKVINYYATLNLSTLKNEIKELGYGLNRHEDANTVTEIGQPVGMWYMLETDGLFQNEGDVSSHVSSDGTIIQSTAKPGDIRFKDNNDDGQITNDDKVVVGSPWPDFELGLNLGASYKGFSLSMNWFGSFGAQVYSGPRSVMDRFDDNSNYRSGVKPWTTENPNTDFPRAYYGSTLNSRGDTDRWLENGSFFRLKYISVGYEIPESIVEKIGFANAQISISGQNLITFTKYSGLDPEFNNSNIFRRGFDEGAFPNIKMYSLGIQFGF
ncbi:MAG TPA: TonB-dependent receptor [Cytophagales bacterium]|nr:TonB-dependent receptor [Cytophagales bacterium]